VIRTFNLAEKAKTHQSAREFVDSVYLEHGALLVLALARALSWVVATASGNTLKHTASRCNTLHLTVLALARAMGSAAATASCNTSASYIVARARSSAGDSGS